MIILLIKILSLFLGITVISKTYLDYKKKQEGLAMFLFWSIAWIVIIYAAIVPEQIYKVMQNFSKQNIGTGTFVGIAFMFLFFVTYRVYTKANRLEQKIKDVVTKIGLKEIEK